MNIKFPSNHEKDPKRRAIGRWIASKRRQYRNGKLSQHWIDKFEQLPGWFWEWENTADEKKNRLLEMAQNGEPRPNRKTKLGGVLSNYIVKNHGSYDAKFDKQVRELAPHWFINTANENKKKLLKMAERGNSKPHYSTLLGGTLSSYTKKSHSSYDPGFNRKIRELAPQWFVKIGDENKKKLIEITCKNEPRPNQKTKLGQALSKYICKKSKRYDPEFDKQIRQLAPHWFKAA